MLSFIELLVLLTSAHQTLAGPLRPIYSNVTMKTGGSATALQKTDIPTELKASTSEYHGIMDTSSAGSLTQSASSQVLIGAQQTQSSAAHSRKQGSPVASTSSSSAGSAYSVSLEGGEPAYAVAATSIEKQGETTTLTIVTTVPSKYHTNATQSTRPISSAASAPDYYSYGIGTPYPYPAETLTSTQSPSRYRSSSLSIASTSETSRTTIPHPDTTQSVTNTPSTSMTSSSIRVTSNPSTTNSPAMHTGATSETASPLPSHASLSYLSGPSSETSASTPTDHVTRTPIFSTFKTESPSLHPQSSLYSSSESSSGSSNTKTTSNAFPYPESSQEASKSPDSSIMDATSAPPASYTVSSSNSIDFTRVSASSSVADPTRTEQRGSANASTYPNIHSNEPGPSQTQSPQATGYLPPIISAHDPSTTASTSTAEQAGGITVVPIDPNMTTIYVTVTDPGWTTTVAKETVTVTAH